MRQAVAVLCDEGLLESTRGRGTVVVGQIQNRRLSHAIIDAISNPLLENKGIRIKVLARQFDRALPSALVDEGTPYPRYTHIRKLHIHQGAAFGHIDIYIESGAYSRLPVHADERQLLSRLLVSDAGVEFTGWSQDTTVTYPEADVAEALEYSMTRPIVLIRRRRFDQRDKIVLAGEYRFRADQFLLRTRGRGKAPQPTLDTADELTKRQSPVRGRA
jgi:GntR family transcriptional regulator